MRVAESVTLLEMKEFEAVGVRDCQRLPGPGLRVRPGPGAMTLVLQLSRPVDLRRADRVELEIVVHKASSPELAARVARALEAR